MPILAIVAQSFSHSPSGMISHIKLAIPRNWISCEEVDASRGRESVWYTVLATDGTSRGRRWQSSRSRMLCNGYCMCKPTVGHST